MVEVDVMQEGRSCIYGGRGSRLKQSTEAIRASGVGLLLCRWESKRDSDGLDHLYAGQVAVFGVPNAVMGELIHAAVVLRGSNGAGSSGTPTPANLLAWSRTRLAPYKARHSRSTESRYPAGCLL